MLLDRDGNLKIADFGLASLFALKGQFKYSTTLCGSPPYVAPEVFISDHLTIYRDNMLIGDAGDRPTLPE